MGCSLDADPNVFEKKFENGLVAGHAYSITDVKLVRSPSARRRAARQVEVTLPNGKSGDIPLIRVRNPWGNESEWKGAWSDQSPEWTCLTQQDREKLGIVFDADGEFWLVWLRLCTNR